MAAMHYTLARLAPAITGRAGATGYSGADMNRTGRLGFRPMDEFGSTVPPLAPAAGGDAGVGGSMGIAPISAAAYNPMATMNHMRFECGVDLKAVLKTSRRQLLKGLWAAPDSPDALNIGYMTLTTR